MVLAEIAAKGKAEGNAALFRCAGRVFLLKPAPPDEPRRPRGSVPPFSGNGKNTGARTAANPPRLTEIPLGMPVNVRTIATVGLLLGLAAVTALVAWHGVGAVTEGLAAAGWGVVLLAVYYFPHFVLFAAAWRLLFLPGREPGMLQSMRAMWIGTSVNTLLPVASIGGELVKIRVLTLRGHSGTDVGASIVVDKTVRAVTLVVWAVIGIAVLVTLKAESELVMGAATGIALMAAGIGGFIAVQRLGMFGRVAKGIAKLTRKAATERLVGGATALDEVIRALYRHYGRIALSCLLRLLARVILAGEVWLAAWLMGHQISVWEAIMLKSLSAALRGAAFAVPAGLGVQEGSFVVLGALFGHPPSLMLAVSLASRVRELIVGLPGLIAWQHLEGRWLWRRRGAPMKSSAEQPRQPS